jgi:membrane fusion protein
MTSPTGAPSFDVDAPFMDPEPPHWAARGLSTVLIGLFVTALLAAIIVRVPETVSGPFVLVPERGADPLRVPREGTVAEVRVVDGQSVARGSTLFVIRSEPVGDRSADMRSLEVMTEGTAARMANARAEYESQRRADELEARRLEGRVASLERISTLKRKQLQTTKEMADRSKIGQQQGAIGGFEADRLVLEADRLATDVEEASAQLDETRAALAKLRQDVVSRDVRHRELVRSLEQENEMSQVRLASMKRALPGNNSGGDLVVTAPCNGTMLRMAVSTAGAVVQSGDVLGEIACSGEKLQVEMTLGQLEVARVRAGQGAKLLYDAYPYQRFGVKFGRVRWVGPASSGRSLNATTAANPESNVFRALIDANDTAIVVRGEAQPLLVGMRGRARVVTGRRTLISYAFEPIRALRENFSGAPEAPTPPPPRPSATTPTGETRPPS